MEDFHMILPSNVANLSGTENKTGHYFTYLPKTHRFEKDKWKVAIVDLSYMYSWFNVTIDNCLVIMERRGVETRSHIPLNNYTNVTAIVTALNRILQDSIMMTRFTVSADNRVTMLLYRRERVILQEITAAMMGFKINDFKIPSTWKTTLRYLATRPPNVHLPLQNIYVYCNIVREIAVGDTFAPLLQVVPVQNKVYGSVQHHEFLNPLYMSLAMDEVSVIEIKLCDQRGNVIAFDIGNVIIKLKFRKLVP
jgi:hypothetical protein